MRRIVICVLAWLTLFCTLAYGAEGEISARVYPAKLFIESEGRVWEVDTMGNDLLNYRGRAYVPLRVFTESLGAEVKFTQASKKTADNVIEIIIESGIRPAFSSSSVATKTSKAVYVERFSSVIRLSMPEYQKEISSVSSDVIKYNSRAYIPLRVLAEAMGFMVKYDGESGPYSMITLSLPKSEDLPYASDDGMISFSVSTREIYNDYGSHTSSVYEATGFLRVNEDIPDGKFVKIEITDGGDKIIGQFDICVDNIYSQPLKKGDVRRFISSFEAKLGYGYKASLCNRWIANEDKPASELLFAGSGVGVARGGVEARKHSAGNMYDISLEFVNSAEKKLTLKPVDLKLEIISMDEGTKGEVVNSVDIAVDKIEIPAGGCLRYVLPTWDGKDAAGVAVGPGSYGFELSGPEKLEYTSGQGVLFNDEWNGFGCPLIVID